MFGFFGRNTDASPPPTFKIFCKAHEGRCLAVRDGALVLAAADPGDERQHWTKDVRYSRVIKDEEGSPVFSLVNTATGLAVQHSLGYQVRLARFYPDGYDESVLWTESADLRKRFGCIRMMHNVDLSLDAPTLDDGNAIVLSYVKGDGPSDGQIWKTAPRSGDACADGLDSLPTSRVYCKANEGFSVTVRNGTVCLAPNDPGDAYQHWIQDTRPGDMIKDIDAYPAFVLVNKVTGEAIAGEACNGCPLKLKLYNPNFLDVSVLWTKGHDMGNGFRCIHMVDNISLNFDAFQGSKEDGSGVRDNRSLNFSAAQSGKGHGRVRYGNSIVLSRWRKEDNLQWKIVPRCKFSIHSRRHTFDQHCPD